MGASSSWKVFFGEERKGIVPVSADEMAELRAKYYSLPPDKMADLRREATKRTLVNAATKLTGQHDRLDLQNSDHAGIAPAPRLTTVMADFADASATIPLSTALVDLRQAGRHDGQCLAVMEKKQLLRVETYYKSGAAASECVKLVAPSAAPFGSFGAVSAGESTLPVVEYRTNPKDICGHVVTRLSVPAREEVMAHFGKLQQIICHRDVEARKVCESDLRRCHLARRCLCSGSGRTLGLFEDRFVSTLKRRFPRLSKHDVVL